MPEWKLFTAYSKLSLKAMLLLNGNKLPSIRVKQAVHLEESYTNMKLLLDSINYKDYQWPICGVLEVIAILMEMQQIYNKFSCFLCKWDSRTWSSHYERKVSPTVRTLDSIIIIVQYIPLLDTEKILLPSVRIKLEHTVI